MGASEIVSVSISLTSVNPSRESFGTGLFVAYHTAYSDLVRSYSDLPSVAVDFPSTTSTVYLAASEYFGDNPAPALLKVGRRTHTSLQVLTLNCLDWTARWCNSRARARPSRSRPARPRRLARLLLARPLSLLHFRASRARLRARAVVITSTGTGQLLQFSGWNRAQLDPELTTSDGLEPYGGP